MHYWQHVLYLCPNNYDWSLNQEMSEYLHYMIRLHVLEENIEEASVHIRELIDWRLCQLHELSWS